MKMIYVFMMLFGMLTLNGCTNEADSQRALESAGYSNIQFTGYQWYSCSKDDNYSTGFTALNPKGRAVEGTVCCGLMKSCTIRF